MTRKKNDTIKPLQRIDASVTEILVAGDGALKPYIQTFHYEPENIALQSLGSVLGIFEIEDQSEDSAYIVNFLASVVKKEYFAHPKRAAIESLEATLHKINLALSELIKQDNTAWLGKLNAAICVLEKNNIHFSVSGKAKTILIRNGVLSDISDGLAEESDLHPLKTFTEVSSGRLRVDDKVILTTPGLFDICSPEELRKNAERFSNEKFAQYVKTALVNQLLFGSTVIVDISEEDLSESILTKAAPQNDEIVQPLLNAFSQTSFSHGKSPEPEKIPENEVVSQESEYIDSKTGHIYVQGDVPEVRPNETWVRFRWLAEEALTIGKDGTKKIYSHILKQTQSVFKKKYRANTTPPSPRPERETLIPAASAQETRNPDYRQENEASAAPSFLHTLSEKIAPFIPSTERRRWLIERVSPVFQFIGRILVKVIPRFSVIKKEFSRLGVSQKRAAVFAVFCIFIVPFLFIRFQEKPKVSGIPPEESMPIKAPAPLASDKNVKNVTSAQSVLANNNIVATALLKDSLFAVTADSVIDITDPKKTRAFNLPKNFGNTVLKAAAMNDLNTLFLLTDTGKIVSFTPINHSFTENVIPLADPSQITGIATYLTYLYVANAAHDSILRYPRAEGGFGEGVSWLKETVDIQETDTLAVSEDLYLSQKDRILAFNRGKKDPIAFESSSTPIVFSATFTQTGTDFLYVLDATNGRLVRFEKSGAIVDQYANDRIKEAKSVTVDEKNKQAYFTTASEVFSLNLE